MRVHAEITGSEGKNEISSLFILKCIKYFTRTSYAPLWEAIDCIPEWHYKQRVNVENTISLEGNGLCFLLKNVKNICYYFPTRRWRQSGRAQTGGTFNPFLQQRPLRHYGSAVTYARNPPVTPFYYFRLVFFEKTNEKLRK